MPKRLIDVAAMLAEFVQSGPLAGGKLRFAARGATDYDEITVEHGPRELEELHELARRTQAQVTQLSGRPELSVVIDIRESGRRAMSAWNPDAGAFLTSAGLGAALLFDPRQFRVAVDPAVTVQREFEGLAVGRASCSGTVKNLGAEDLAALELECASRHYELQGPPRLLILRDPDGAPGWLYEDGKLITGEPPGQQ